MTELPTFQTVDRPRSLPRPSQVVGPVAVDCETSGLHKDDGARVSAVSVAFRVEGDPVPYSAAFPFGQGPEDASLDLGRAEWRHLMRWLSSAGGGLVGHNIRFDVLQLANQSINGYPGVDLLDRVISDTWVVAAELWPEQKSHALKKLAVKLWGGDADEEQRALAPHLGPKTNPRFDLVPWEVMEPYARADAELTLALHEHLQQWLKYNSMAGGFIGQEMDILKCLARMEQAGLPYLPEVSRECGRQLDSQVKELEAKLPFKNTPARAKKYFFESGEMDLGAPSGQPVQGLGLPVVDRTPSGQPKLTASVVQRLVRDGAPHAAELQTVSRYRSACSKWYFPFADRAGADGRVRTSFRHVGGTKSGRFSASRINLQAVPKDYALHLPVKTPRQIVAEAVERLPGWQLWELDLEQAELRLAAMDAQCDSMLDVIREGRDPHGETASALFGVAPGDDQWDFYRSISKRANFSLIFGSGPATFQEMLANQAGVELPLEQVRRIVYDWRDLYPQFGWRIDECMAEVDAAGFVRMTTGRKRYYARGEDSHSAFNQRIQGSLAEYGKRWLIETDRNLRHLRQRGVDEGIGLGGLVLVVHDSQVLLLPDEVADESVRQVQADAKRLWDEMFPKVPGGTDASRWA